MDQVQETLPCEYGARQLLNPELAKGRLMLAPHYALLRRALAQTAGLMLVHRASRTMQLEQIGCALEAASTECQEAIDGLTGLAMPGPLRPIHADLCQAAQLMVLAIRTLGRSLAPGTCCVVEADRAIAPLRQAHRLMAAASDDRYGMGMVSFGHACCGGAQGLLGSLEYQSAPKFNPRWPGTELQGVSASSHSAKAQLPESHFPRQFGLP